MEERKNWRKNPSYGFVARPSKNPDGTLNLNKWECVIPGKEGTSWMGGFYKMDMIFGEDYPNRAPSCKFNPPIFHVNIYSTGSVCTSFLNQDWHRDTTVKQILLGIQDLLDAPNIESPACSEAYDCYCDCIIKYNDRIRAQAQKFSTI